MGFDSYSLFAANAVILFVMAAVFHRAGTGRDSERYWRSWSRGNMLLGTALIVFMFERQLNGLFVAILPNALLVTGFAVRWQAAREFSGRPASAHLVWGPALAFTLFCCVPWISGNYVWVYTIVNVILAAVALAIAWEFWRDRADGLTSRYGLVLSYGLMGLSFAARAGQGAFYGSDIGDFMPRDAILELHLLIATLHTASSGGFALSMAYERNTAELKHAATHDFLTGLLNRRAFEDRLRSYMESDERGDFALVLLDIDHFKRINDRHGHAAGDAALRTCATVMKDSLRAGDFVARIGGEEFALVLKHVSPKEARLAAERMRCRIAGLPMASEKGAFRLTVSAGIAHGDESRTLDSLMSLADGLLYRAKSGGRDRIECAA